MLTRRIDGCRRLSRVGWKVSVCGVVAGNIAWRIKVGEVAAVEFLVLATGTRQRELTHIERSYDGVFAGLSPEMRRRHAS